MICGSLTNFETMRLKPAAYIGNTNDAEFKRIIVDQCTTA